MNLRRFTKKRKNDLIYAGACIVHAVARTLPRRIGRPLFGALGSLGFLIPSRERDRTIAHLTTIYHSTRSSEQIHATAREVFTNIGRNLFDAVYLARIDESKFDRLVVHDNLDAFSRAYALGKGVIVITAHLGCFEMLLNFFNRKGFRSFAIGREVYDPRLDRIIANARRGGGAAEYLHRTENPRTILRYLAAGKAMGVLIDQDTSTDGVFAPFLGKVAFTPSGPIKMAMRYGIPAFVVTTAAQVDGTHRIFIEGPLSLPVESDFDRSLVQNVAQANQLISRVIERFPEQWVWMHRRWRHRPTDKGFEKVPRYEDPEVD